MTTDYPENLSVRTGKMKKFLVTSAAALLLGLGLAVPVSGMPAAPGTPAAIEEGKNVSVFHNLDFVAAFGYNVGEKLTVDVYRNGVNIGHAFGPAVSAPEGLPKDGALEVNHGPEGPAVQGDCWDGYTPDIQPGDLVKITDGAGGTDEVLVDNITISGAPEENVAGEVIVKGRASFADGTPIPIEQLNSGEMRSESPRFRATPNSVERDPAFADGWIATYRAPYDGFQEPRPLSDEQKKQAILDGDHAMGYGHVAPLPTETQLVDGIGGGGPALGCEASPSSSNAVATFDDRFVNINSGDLRVNGVAASATGSVSVSIDDEDPATSAITADVAPTDLSAAGPGGKTWTVNVPRDLPDSTNDLASLTDGKLTVSATYAGGGETGATKTIQKDTAAPDIQTDPASGSTHVGSVGVALSLLGGEALQIRYTTDGSDPSIGGKLYDGQRIQLGVGSHTIKASATDGAGNATQESYTYTVQAPPPPPPVVTPPPASGGPIVGTAGNDVLRGTPGNDVINGLGGNDTIIGGGGNDRINGGAGNDTLRGGAGVDTIVGGAGVDKLYGDSGNDRLNGRDGKPRDLLNGGSGRDTGSSDSGDIRRAIP